MLKKLKQKAKEKGRRYADKVSGSSSSGRPAAPSSPAPINKLETTNPIAPDAELQAPASNPNALAPPATAPITQPAVASAALLSTDAPQPTFHTNASNLLTVQEPAPVQEVALALPAEGSGRSTAWSGLKTLVGVVGESVGSFGPLKSAFGEIGGFIEIFERVARGREDYNKLRDELDSLLKDISSYLAGPSPPVMTPSLNNLANGIKIEMESVRRKTERNSVERAAEATDDAGEILRCYRQIQRLLEKFSLNANASTWKTIDEQTKEYRLKALSPSLAAQYSSAESTDLRRNGCIPNTRVDLLKKIKGWAEDRNSKRIYWLNGMAGTGKTTIAYSLCNQLESSLTLAASFFCSRQLTDCRNVKFIMPTVAYQLARFSLPFQHALSSALEQAPDVHTLKVSTQFQKLIFEPLISVQHTISPDLVVVIDALDECDSKDGVDQIIEVLLAHAPRLPIKFFVASRPEARIQDHMRAKHSRDVPEKLDLHDLNHSLVREDIKTFLKAELDSPKLVLTDTNLETLADQSGVLFIYAATVARYIRVDNFSRGAKQLTQVLAASSSRSRRSVEMDSLYEDILRAALDDNTLEDSERKEMQEVLNTVICAQGWMTAGVIAGLLKLDVDSVEAALRPLSSVLHLSTEANGVVSPFHASFPEYILNKDRAKTFYCDSKNHNARLVHQCFDIIRAHNPPFNICGLQSSYMFDEDVPNIDERVRSTISDTMFYACRHWVAHLILSEPASNLLDILCEFLSVRLLLWIEVMTLKQCIGIGVGILHQVQTYAQIGSYSEDLKDLALDAWRFAMAFSTSQASRSTPHLYMSALLFWPSERPISKCYLPRTQGLARVAGGALKTRNRAPLVVCRTESEVLCVAYSFDGTHIVSGYGDGTMRIWDAHTGQLVGEPLVGHKSAVTSVGYSFDGTQIFSGSGDKTIQIWDVQTGQIVGAPLMGHTYPVTSAAYSPDGKSIISGSEDQTVRIWDVRTSQMVGMPLQGHSGPVRSVGYSPDGARIVSSSSDNSIRIWDVGTGQMVGEPLRGHTSSVTSVGYSSDGTHIVSGSDDKTIRIWDVRTRQLVREPLIGHTSAVYSVAYSQDSTRIVSGSYDQSIRIWDAHTGQLMSELLHVHSSAVTSVRYSFDGTRIISGSWDKTVQIWDVDSCEIMAEPTHGHTGAVYSVAYSHDGRYAVSGSDDKTVRIWDALTGQTAGESLEGHTGTVFSVGFSHDGAHIVSGSHDGTVRIWDARTYQSVGDLLEGHTDAVFSVGYSYDGTRIVSGSYDETIRIWDAQTGQMVGEPLIGHTSAISSVTYACNSTRIVSGSYDQSIRVWDAHTGEMVGEALEGHTDAVISVACSHDGTHIVSGSYDTTIRIWDAQTGHLIGEPLRGHTGGVQSLAYSHDDTRIVSGSSDKTVGIWDAYTGRMLGELLKGHTDVVKSVVFSNDSTCIVSCSADNTIRFWDAQLGQTAHGTLDGHTVQVPISQRIGNKVYLIPEMSSAASGPVMSSHTTDNVWEMGEDGWVVGDGFKLLMWVPSDLWRSLLHPRSLFIISRSGSLALDFSDAKLGERWRECYCPQEKASL